MERAVADQLCVITWTCDAEGRNTHVDPLWCAYSGQTKEQATGFGWMEAIHPDDRARSAAATRATIISRQPFRIEHRVRRADGAYRWMLVVGAPRVDESGAFAGYVGSIVDIEESRRAEIELRESEKRYRLLHESLRDPFVRVDMSGRIIEFNELFRQMVGYPEEELAAMTYQQLTPDRWRVAERRVLEEQILARGYSDVYEKEYRRMDGTVFPVELRTILSRDADGAPAAMWAIVRDISDRKRAEEELREADRRKSDFLATLAHELRNPLSPLHNGVQILLKRNGVESAERDRTLLSMMSRQLAQLVRLVDDLLEVSRINRGKIDLRKEQTDIARVLRGAMETSQPFIERGGHRATLSLPVGPAPIFGDPTRLSQVFTNLLNNAAKFTPDGGRIDIESSCLDDSVVVTVKDNGRGIAPDDLPHVFDMFAQTGKSLGEGGLGIGLALARRLVELHGGTIEAQSAGEGQGSTFVVKLPRAAPAPAETALEICPPLPTGKRALIVDDERDVADTLSMLLETLGASVRVAYGGVAAVAELAAFEPDIVFLDLGMPEQDGFETARLIREREAGQRVTLVALTGWGQDEDRGRTRGAGFDAHLTKPASVESLAALLRSKSSKGS